MREGSKWMKEAVRVDEGEFRVDDVGCKSG